MEFSNEAKYLRVIIDNKLTWCQHIEKMKNKISKRLGILKQMRHFFQEDTLVSLFYAFLKPYIDYGSLTWGDTANTHLLKLKAKANS